MTKRKVRKGFDKTQPIRVDVSDSCVEEKIKVQQAFFDIGVEWSFTGKGYIFDAACYTNITPSGDIIDFLMWGCDQSVLDNECITPEDFFNMVYED